MQYYDGAKADENKTRYKPIWKHDCTACVFIGGRGKWDIYVCPGNSIIERYGNEPWENCSGANFVTGGQFFHDYCDEKGHIHIPKDGIDNTNAAAVVLAEYALMCIERAQDIDGLVPPMTREPKTVRYG